MFELTKREPIPFCAGSAPSLRLYPWVHIYFIVYLIDCETVEQPHPVRCRQCLLAATSGGV